MFTEENEPIKWMKYQETTVEGAGFDGEWAASGTREGDVIFGSRDFRRHGISSSRRRKSKSEISGDDGPVLARGTFPASEQSATETRADEKPAEYYRYYGDSAKLLPLRIKGWMANRPRVCAIPVRNRRGNARSVLSPGTKKQQET